MSRSRSLCLASALALASVAGCGIPHHYRLEGFDAQAAPLARSQARRVAVVFAEPAFATLQETGADGHTFFFEDLNAFYERALGSALRGRVATVDFVVGSAPPGYDAYVYVALELQVSAGFVTKTCAATYGLRVEDGERRQLASESARGAQDFVVISTANESCQIAMLSVFDQVTYPVLAAIDALPSPLPPTAGGEIAVAPPPPVAAVVVDPAADGCTPGMTRNDATDGRCCWPAQIWSSTYGRCSGPPACPEGRVAEGDDCIARAL